VNRLVAIIERLNALKGKISDKSLRLKARISQDSNKPKAVISQTTLFGGKWYRRIGFDGVIKVLLVLYRFIAYKVRLFLGLKAKADTAQAREIEADKSTAVDTEVPLNTHSAEEIIVDSNPDPHISGPPKANDAVEMDGRRIMPFSRFVGFVSYVRAGLSGLRCIPFHLKSGLDTAPAKTTSFRKGMKLGRTSNAEAADSAIMESRFNSFTAESEAHGISAPGVTTESARIMQPVLVAKAINADCPGVNINRATTAAVKAAPYAWFLSVFTDGTLELFQVMSGVQSGHTVEIDMEAESVYWANAFVHDGTANLVFAQTEPQTSGELELI
jgi:hypothetical protein